MTLNEAATILGVSPNTLRHQVANGRLRTEKHGSIHWVTPAEVERYRVENLGRYGRKAK